jgi:uncharacterized protein (UPF0335 family)
MRRSHKYDEEEKKKVAEKNKDVYEDSHHHNFFFFSRILRNKECMRAHTHRHLCTL